MRVPTIMTLTRRTILASALAPLASRLAAQPAARHIERWDRFEISLAGPPEGNPFLDVQVSAEFRQQHRGVQVDGCYDGGGAYKVRFSPDAEGEWRSEEHTSELQSLRHLVCRLLLEKKSMDQDVGRSERGCGASRDVRCRSRTLFGSTGLPPPAHIALPPLNNIPPNSLFFFNDTATTEIYTLSLHDALPISGGPPSPLVVFRGSKDFTPTLGVRSEEHTSELQSLRHLVCRLLLEKKNNK